MKTTIFSLLLACGVTAFGQFIPQPMGYNPDVNGDEFIGVDDVMGTLALYDNAFDNGDSLVITSWTFPEDYPPDYEIIFGGRKVEVDENTDVLYLTQTVDEEIALFLPQGEGFKVLQVFLRCEGFAQWPLVIYRTSSGGSYTNGGQVNVQNERQRLYTFIRGHDGLWYE